MNQNDQNELVERILKSNSFGSSALYLNLLKYLVKCSQSGEIPKEAEIGLHIFGDQGEEYGDNGKVRVHIFNLRKKLSQYFETEGIHEKVILTIPKGGYAVEFQERVPQYGIWGRLFQKDLKWVYVLFSGLLIILIIYQFIGKQDVGIKEQILAESPIWSEFIASKKPVLIVLGDMFVFSETNKQTGESRSIRIPDINSQQEFEVYRQARNDTSLELKEHTYTYLIRNSIDWIQGLTQLFYASHKTFQIRVISRIEARDLHDHNVIFVGMQKTAHFFNNYFNTSDFSYAEPVGYTFKEKSYAPFGDPDNLHTDYAFVTKYRGPENNIIFMFSGIWDTGASQGLDNFLNTNSLQKIESAMEDQFEKIPDTFEVLFEVAGVDRTEMDTKLLYLEKTN